jgi:uncharacterized SAM-binding protein YcdF (DUF218 family)
LKHKRTLQVVGVAALACATLFVALASRINVALSRNDELVGTPVAIVALSSGLLANGGLDRFGMDRLIEASNLAVMFPTARLITTRVRNSSGLASDAAQQRLLLARQFPPSRWTILAPVVSSTRDEARSLADAHIADSTLIVVVTSEPHTTRACATFERIGFRVICRTAVSSRQPWWRPSFDLFYEGAATAVYWFRGWI